MPRLASLAAVLALLLFAAAACTDRQDDAEGDDASAASADTTDTTTVTDIEPVRPQAASSGGVVTDARPIALAEEPPAAEQDTLVALERTECFGTCPVYELALLGTGAVFYHGKKHVATTGRAKVQIPPAQVDSLAQAAVEAGFFDLPANPTCEERMTDLPSAVLHVRLGERERRYMHYHGCKGFEGEDALYALAESIDRIAGTTRWTKAEDAE
jgi:hypothetical protein